MREKEVFIVLLIAGSCLLTSCSRTNNDQVVADADSSQTSDTSIRYFETPDSSFEVMGIDSALLWIVNADAKTMKRPASQSTPAMSVIINSLNAQYPGIRLTDPVMNHDTLSLKIPDSDYLTNQIGSSGAAQYIAQAIINLTSLPGVKYVKIDFKMGSHASPGVWSRSDFSDYQIVQ